MEINQSLQELDAYKEKYLIEHGNARPEFATYSYRIVISNKDCKINGYSMYDSFQSTSFI